MPLEKEVVVGDAIGYVDREMVFEPARSAVDLLPI
jgi:hypothetical protein